jgi:hypothetical protein
VFLQGLWRSGSTYVWSRFRRDAAARCYFEPLHEGMGRLTPKRIWRESGAMGEGLRHPRLDAPYFAEYAPLLARRGVARYRPGFARERFALGPEDRHAPLERYIDGLIAHAWSEGRVPVLGFNRGNFRMGWMARRFDPCTVFVERDAEAVWGSYMDHAAQGNFTFLKNWLLILERNRRCPLFAPLAEIAPLRRGLTARLRKPKHHYAEVIAAARPEDLYLMVRYLWTASLAQAAAHAQVIVDVSAASDDPGLARSAGAAMRAACGLKVDFADCRAPAPHRPLDPAVRRALDADAMALLPDAALAPLAQARVQADLTLLRPEKAALVRWMRGRARGLVLRTVEARPQPRPAPATEAAPLRRRA